jgi:hypothetical protein
MIEPYTGAPLPDPDDADDVPSVLAAIFDVVGSMHVLRAADQAERNTKYGAAPSGVIVATLADDAVWLKTGPGPADWSDVLSDTGDVNAGFTAFAGWEVNYGYVRRIGKMCQMDLQLKRTGADIPTSASGVHAGNIVGDPSIATIPDGFRPARLHPIISSGSWASWNCTLHVSGIIVLMHGTPMASLEQDTNLTMHSMYFVA